MKGKGKIVVQVEVTCKVIGARFKKVRWFIAKWICIIVSKLLKVKFKMDIKQVRKK
jgi:hypothetical protein